MAVNGNLFPWKVPRPHSYSTPILASSRGIEPTSDRCVVRNNLKAHVIGLPVRKLEHLNRSTTIARAGCWRECLLSQYWASITSEAKRLIVDSLYDALLDRFLPNKHPCTNGAYCMDQRWTRFSLHAWQHIHRGKWTHYTCVACEVSMGIHTWQFHRHHKQRRLCNFSPFILMWHLIISRLWVALPIHRLTVWLSCLYWYLVTGIHARGAMTLPSAAKILRLSNWAKWLPNHGQTRTKIRLAIWDFESLRINHLCFLRVGSLEGTNFYLNHMIDVCAKEQRQQGSWGNQTTLNWLSFFLLQFRIPKSILQHWWRAICAWVSWDSRSNSQKTWAWGHRHDTWNLVRQYEYSMCNKILHLQCIHWSM